MVTANLERRRWKESRIVFAVPLPGADPVYMSINVTEDGKDRFGVIIVDSGKFLRLWRSTPYGMHQAVANGSPETWPNDSKYSWAVKGFSHSRENPVPLADISYGITTRTSVSHRFLWLGRTERQEQIQHVSFGNGITRTIWLLTQGCMAFPVMCKMPSARELFRVAAAEGTAFHTVGDLAGVASHT